MTSLSIKSERKFLLQNDNEQAITVEEETTGDIGIQVKEALDNDTPEFSKNYYFIIGTF